MASIGTGALSGETCPVRVIHPEAIERAQGVLRSDEHYADLAETFRALGDATRAKMLHALAAGPLCVCDLAALVGVSESAISQHLRVLRGLRIVQNRKAGRVVYYQLADSCILSLLTVALEHLDDPLPPPAHLTPVPASRQAPAAVSTERSTQPKSQGGHP